MPSQKKEDPNHILQNAVEELEVFSSGESSVLDIGEDGRLIASKQTTLEKMVELVQTYLSPFLSSQLYQKRKEKIEGIKRAILHARDTIQSHFPLIEKLKMGDESQKKLAECALNAIQRYNAVIDPSSSKSVKYETYNYQRQCLLLDQEIAGCQIELPQPISLNYQSHPYSHSAQQVLKELSHAFAAGAEKKSLSKKEAFSKHNLQFMKDTFHMKVIRMAQMHLEKQHPIEDILSLAKEGEIEIQEGQDGALTMMRQVIEVGPGFWVEVSGSFKRNAQNPKFMAIPISESFRINYQVTHTGFPYSSQRAGWVLGEKWVEACPLRLDQTPFFQSLNQRKKQLGYQLLFDQEMNQEARQQVKIKREVFNRHLHLFVPLHRQLQEKLGEYGGKAHADEKVLNDFYQEAMQAPSPFDFFVQTEQQLIDFFMTAPLNALEEEWIESENSVLRIGPAEQKIERIREIFQQPFQRDASLPYSSSVNAYLLQQGAILGQAFLSIALQYQSEKIGFSPPLLNDFERKLQACAFQQLASFLQECEQIKLEKNADEVRDQLLDQWKQDLYILSVQDPEDAFLSVFEIVNELEVYFNSRFYLNR